MAENNTPAAFPNLSNQISDPRTGVINQIWYRFFISLFQRTGAQQGGNVATSGDIKAIGGTSVPEGWLLCDGSAVDRVGFASLFAAIGTTWGIGNGSSTFNIPDLRGRMLIGANGTYPLGSRGGSASMTLGINNLPVHNHDIDDPGHQHSIGDPGHIHGVPKGIAAGTNAFQADRDNDDGYLDTSTDVTGIIQTEFIGTGITTLDTGNGEPFSTISPWAAVNWVIKQ